MKKREDGYYWIKLDNDKKWYLAELDEGFWFIIGNEREFYDSEIAEVGERIIKK